MTIPTGYVANIGGGSGESSWYQRRCLVRLSLSLSLLSISYLSLPLSISLYLSTVLYRSPSIKTTRSPALQSEKYAAILVFVDLKENGQIFPLRVKSLPALSVHAIVWIMAMERLYVTRYKFARVLMTRCKFAR